MLVVCSKMLKPSVRFHPSVINTVANPIFINEHTWICIAINLSTIVKNDRKTIVFCFVFLLFSKTIVSFLEKNDRFEKLSLKKQSAYIKNGHKSFKKNDRFLKQSLFVFEKFKTSGLLLNTIVFFQKRNDRF